VRRSTHCQLIIPPGRRRAGPPTPPSLPPRVIAAIKFLAVTCYARARFRLPLPRNLRRYSVTRLLSPPPPPPPPPATEFRGEPESSRLSDSRFVRLFLLLLPPLPVPPKLGARGDLEFSPSRLRRGENRTRFAVRGTRYRLIAIKVPPRRYQSFRKTGN